MGLVRSIAKNYRFLSGPRRFLSEPISQAQARALVERQLAERNESFLDLLERTVYANPGHPYCRLLHRAGFELEDLRHLVSELGLEGALENLYDAGVYISQDEFKGRKPIRRGDLVIETDPTDFNNPLLKPIGDKTTSGSTGRPTPVLTDFRDLEARASYVHFSHLALIGSRPFAQWKVGSSTGTLILVKIGRSPERVFSTIAFRWTFEGVRAAILSELTLLAAKLYGRPIPRPVVVARDEVAPVVRWLAEKTAQGMPAAVDCGASLAVRACIYAREHGLDISGTLFIVSGEPYTSAKAEVLRSVGAEARSRYVSSDMGTLGVPCALPLNLDEVHLQSDRIALITREKVGNSGPPVAGLVYTSLRSETLKLMLNLDSGDYANVYQRACGCILNEMGFTTHISGIGSYDKLTSEGVTFLGWRLYDLVEQELPARFGGATGDYQLVEDEEAGLPRVSVFVSPRVGAIDEGAVLATVMDGLKHSHAQGGELMTEQFRQANTLRVIRREPYRTSSLKTPPIHVIRGASDHAQPARNKSVETKR